MEEIPLTGGWVTEGVVRVGDTVRRPSRPSSEYVHTVLEHLERCGFDAAPRFLGYDEDGREALTFLEGEVLHDCHALVLTDKQLTVSAQLLKSYHDCTALLEDDAEVICHGDYGPWNLVWRDELPIAIIDFDNVHPGDRREDVGYALWKHLNLGLIDVPVTEQARRLRVFAAAYDMPVDNDLLEAIHASQELFSRIVAGTPAVNKHERERRWLAEHGRELVGERGRPEVALSVLPAANRRIPASSVARIASAIRAPCVLGLLGFRSADQEPTPGRPR